MRVSLFGMGYVGLVQAVCLAESGHDVCAVDSDQDKIDALNRGQIAFYEPGLAAQLAHNIDEGRLTFRHDLKPAINSAEVLFLTLDIATGTDGCADLRALFNTAQTLGEQLNHDAVVVVKSAAPVGTGDRVQQVIDQQLQARQQDCQVTVVANPEFFKMGSALADCARPDRILIGTDSDFAEQQMRALYAAFNRTRDRILVMDRRSAELSRYATNAMLATKVSFMNELANLAEKLGADMESVRHGMGSDPRIGYQFIYPGCGYGGAGFPKDVRALAHCGEQWQVETAILNAVCATNCKQKQKLLNYLQHHFASLQHKTIAVWGLAFKPNTDAICEAPSLDLIEGLCLHGARVRLYDPKALTNARAYFGDRHEILYCQDKYEALTGADAVVICTEWNEFWAPDFARMRQRLHQAVVIDGRNLYDPRHMRHLGFHYYGIGRGESVQRPEEPPQNHRTDDA